ncbi:MAG TPA: DUF5615 family PIN-like protein [Myxococcota bacterium]|nr:DUF5615 family PIN-like protein [Myxococcota bacterium]
MGWRKLPPSGKEERAEFLRRNRRRAKFLVDESLGSGTAERLRREGWNVRDTTEAGLRGRSDEEILGFALRYGRMLLTCDGDFLNDRKFPPHRNPGLVVLPSPERGEQEQRTVLRYAMEIVGCFPDPFSPQQGDGRG